MDDHLFFLGLTDKRQTGQGDTWDVTLTLTYIGPGVPLEDRCLEGQGELSQGWRYTILAAAVQRSSIRR